MLALASVGCRGSGSSGEGGTSTDVHSAKTKLGLYARLAFGAFHRDIYKPLAAAGSLLRCSTRAIVKAGVVSLFVYHEVKIALVDARSSSMLFKLVTLLTALQSKLTGLHHSLSAGHLDSSAIDTVNSTASSMGSQSAHSGATIRELATSKLG